MLLYLVWTIVNVIAEKVNSTLKVDTLSFRIFTCTLIKMNEMYQQQVTISTSIPRYVQRKNKEAKPG